LIDLRFSDAADFEALYAAPLTAEDSNSAFVGFQKLGQKFDKRIVGAAFQRGGLQANFYGSGNLAHDFIFAGAGLDTHGKNDGAGGEIFSDLKHRVSLPGSLVLHWWR
jgi:hypothetical protein